jgi:putative oxidoreductase
MAGFLFLEHGLQKVFGILGGFQNHPGVTAPVMSRYGPAMLFETVGAALIIVGFMTRPVAVIIIAEMIVAYFLVHAPNGLFPIQNGGELALLDACVFMLLAVYGAGPFSVDESMRSGR